MRLGRGTGLSVLLAIALWFVGASGASAAGYWTCSDGKWTAVGQPQHGVPVKSSGSLLEIPRTQADCEQAGGNWGRGRIHCRVPTHDGGRVCADTGECEGLCLAALTRAQIDLVRTWRHTGQKLETLGKCTPYVPVLGCTCAKDS
jgi:hypothetical protein